MWGVPVKVNWLWSGMEVEIEGSFHFRGFFVGEESVVRRGLVLGGTSCRSTLNDELRRTDFSQKFCFAQANTEGQNAT